jgi:DNA primase
LGQDPDTLAQQGGAGAIRQLMDDAIDVLERKLQLLDRKGWLGTLSGRRKALDRIVPTIRAAADPVTRDLYVSRTAEALGVSGESVRREAETGRRGTSGSGSARSRASAAPTDSAAPSGRAIPERELLRVMLHAPEWRRRIGDLLSEPGSLHQPEGELIQLVAGAEPDAKAHEFLSLTDGKQRTLVAGLIDQGLGEKNVDAIVEGALNRLENRPLRERKRAVSREIAVAAEDEKVRLLEEKTALSRKSRKLNTPEWNVIRRGGDTGAG